MRGLLMAVLASGILATGANSAAAQTAVRFTWQQGETLTYRVDQTTSASDLVEGQKTETSSKMTTVKHWRVLAVDPAGVATLQLSLASLRFEVKTPKDTTLIFDSTRLDESDPQLREQLGKAGRQTAEQYFDRTRLGIQLAPIYRSLVPVQSARNA